MLVEAVGAKWHFFSGIVDPGSGVSRHFSFFDPKYPYCCYQRPQTIVNTGKDQVGADFSAPTCFTRFAEFQSLDIKGIK